jgi:hypothetical protein
MQANTLRKLANAITPQALLPPLLRLEIGWQNFEKTPPILIYQCGKVGSSTVRKTLRHASLANPIYQVHCLSDEGIQRYEERRRKSPQASHVRECLAVSQSLRQKLDSGTSTQMPVKIITLTREPIGLMISSFFEAISGQESFERLDEDALVDESMKRIRRQLRRFDESSNRVCTWFDRELKATFDIDVFAYPFDPAMGYQIISQGAVDLLIIRLEDLNRCGSEVLAQFLERDRPIPLINANQRNAKEFATAYTRVKETIKIPKHLSQAVYDSRYATHFYSESERQSFIEKWARRQSVAV